MLIGQSATVLGGGVAGLAVARALAMRGAAVTLYEQAEALTDLGAGLQISPNGFAVLRALGLDRALVAAAMPASAVEIRNGSDGGLLMQMDLAGLGYHLTHRADLIDVLASGAREVGVDIRLNARVDRVMLAEDGPQVVFADGTRVAAPLLIGADGLHSRLRPAINGSEAPFFTQQVAWRAVIPGEPGAAPVAQVFTGPGRHLVSYPLRGGLLRNIVAVEERRRWADEGWHLRDDSMPLRLAFRDFCPLVRGWLDQVEDPWLWGLFRHEVASRFFAAGPGWGAALLGDAAHPTLPFLAQGANMALEDAWVLADCLSAHEDTASALAAYQLARRARVLRIVEAANRNAKLYHLSGPVGSFAHVALKLAGALMPGRALKSYDWLYRHDVTEPQG